MMTAASKTTKTSAKACYFVFLLCLILHTSSVQSFSVIQTTRRAIDNNISRRRPPSAAARTRHHPHPYLHQEQPTRRTTINHHSNEANFDICWQPSRIEISNLSHQYPVTLWRTLTSSEPRRQFAVDLSLTLEPFEFVLLLGDSSSGKSTLLKLILGQETPVSGSIQIIAIKSEDNMMVPAAAVPILLEQRPVYSNRPQSVQIILQEKLIKSPLLQENEEVMARFLKDLCDTLGLPLEKKGSDLSPSEVYCCAMAEASIESMVMMTSQSEKEKEGETILHVSAPILFLDEWMDKETSTVVQKVQSSILKLVDRGAIVVSITHKPNLYKQSAAGVIDETEESKVRSITLRRGKIQMVA